MLMPAAVSTCPPTSPSSTRASPSIPVRVEGCFMFDSSMSSDRTRAASTLKACGVWKMGVGMGVGMAMGVGVGVMVTDVEVSVSTASVVLAMFVGVADGSPCRAESITEMVALDYQCDCTNQPDMSFVAASLILF